MKVLLRTDFKEMLLDFKDIFIESFDPCIYYRGNGYFHLKIKPDIFLGAYVPMFDKIVTLSWYFTDSTGKIKKFSSIEEVLERILKIDKDVAKKIFLNLHYFIPQEYDPKQTHFLYI